MDQTTLHETEARCTQEAMPRCRARCPFRMDIRAFMVAMADGRVKEARKLLERHLPLPGILARICDHPCEEPCLRRELGGSLAIGALEAACVSGAQRQTASFPRAPKAVAIAVLGNTLAGLVVAFELSKKAYPVTIFHTGEPHEALVRRFPALSEALVVPECEALVKAGCTFARRPLDAALLEEVTTTHAAVFVDGDTAPALFMALEALPDALTRLVAGNVCAGGFPEGAGESSIPADAGNAEVFRLARRESRTYFYHDGFAGHGTMPSVKVGAGLTPCQTEIHQRFQRSASKQAGEGRRAAVTMERLITRVSLTAGREGELTTQTPLFTSLDGILAQNAVIPRSEQGYTPEEAALEASRCIRCECLACVRECVYLKKYGGYPKSYTRQIYNNASIVKGEHLANSLINGCMLCGQCAEVCPERFSMAELCLHARQDMVTRRYMPPSAHEFALEDMANAGDCALFMGDPEGKKTRYVFFPGCQLAASRGEQVLATYTFLRGMLPVEDGVGLFLACCGVPARWAGDETLFQQVGQGLRREWEKLGKPTLVAACASCLKTLRDSAPDIPCTSLWEMLEAHFAACPEPSPSPSQRRVIHDPCAARHDPDWQRAVRALAARCGVALSEPERTGRETACCGYGGLVWSAQPDLADAVARRRVEDLGSPSLVSCIMCRDRFAGNGGDCLHLLDVLPFSRMEETPPPPGLSARRANRAALRDRVKRVFLHEEATPEKAYAVEIPPAVLDVLERGHILRDDVEGAVAAVEGAKTRFRERATGHYVGSWRPRNVTFWVRYSVTGEGAYLLHDAWSHRMTVPGTGGIAS